MNLCEYSTPDLFKLHHYVLAELRRREHIRSGNNIVSDYAESITCKALGLTQVRSRSSAAARSTRSTRTAGSSCSRMTCGESRTSLT